jgi:hypothetical protein
MRIGIDAGPSGAARHQSSHYVYDAQSGAIVAVYHFVGQAPESDSERVEQILANSQEASGIPIERLAVLSNPDLPAGTGELRADHAAKRLVRKASSVDPRIRP